MRIGQPVRKIIVEPLELPVGNPEHYQPEEEPVYAPEQEPEKVPVQVP
jgi:hypothetical protein